MASSAEFEELRRILTEGMRPSSVKSPSERAEQAKESQILKDNTSALKYLKEAIRKNNSLVYDITNVSKAQNKILDSTVDTVSDLKELEKLPDKFRKSLNDSGSAFAKALAINVNSLEDIFSSQGKLEKLPQVQALVHSFVAGEKSMGEVKHSMTELGLTTAEISAAMSRFENGLTGANGHIVKGNKARAQAAKALDAFDKEVKDANDSVRNFGETVEKERGGFSKHFGKIGAVVVGLSRELYTAAQASMKFGSELSLVQSRMAGMSPEDYAQMQGENRQAINALTGGFKQFNTLIDDSNMDLVKYTGSLADSSRLIASMVTTSRSLGSASVDTNKFVQSQKNVFKSFHDELSMTSEQFAAMNARLVQDSDIRSILYRQNEQQRVQHFKGLQQQIKTYRSWGMLQEQSEALAKSMDKITGKDAKTRMKEAARLRATMGAMGMGSQGAKAQAIMLKGSRATETERQDLAKILKSANEEVGKRMGSSFQSELQTQAMIQRAGLAEYLGPNSTMVDAILGKGAAQKEKNAKNPLVEQFGKGTTGIMAMIVGQTDRILTFLSGGFLTSLIGALSLSKFGKGMFSFIKSKGGSLLGLGKGASMAESAVGGVAATGSKLLRVGGGLVTGGAMIGKDVYDVATGDASNENIGGVAGGVIGGAIGSFIAPGVGTAIGMAAGNFIGNELGKLLDDNDKDTNDAAKKQLDQTEQLQETLEKLHNAVENGNKKAAQTALNTANTQMAIMNQTKTQSSDAEKDREQADTKLRHIRMRSPGRRRGGGTSGSW